MPFLTKTEFQQYASTQMVNVLEHDTNAFDEAERGAGQTVVRITGVQPPADAVNAPAWSKQPMKWLVYDIMIDSLKNVSEETMQRARDNRRKAIEELQGWRNTNPSVGIPETGLSSYTLWL
jgi:hypothetical protein